MSKAEKLRRYRMRKREYWATHEQICPDCGRDFFAPTKWKCCKSCRTERQKAGRAAAKTAARDAERAAREALEAKRQRILCGKMDAKELAELTKKLGRKPTEGDLATHEVENYNKYLRPEGAPELSYGQYFGQVRLGKIISPYGRKG